MENQNSLIAFIVLVSMVSIVAAPSWGAEEPYTNSCQRDAKSTKKECGKHKSLTRQIAGLFDQVASSQNDGSGELQQATEEKAKTMEVQGLTDKKSCQTAWENCADACRDAYNYHEKARAKAAKDKRMAIISNEYAAVSVAEQEMEVANSWKTKSKKAKNKCTKDGKSAVSRMNVDLMQIAKLLLSAGGLYAALKAGKDGGGDVEGAEIDPFEMPDESEEFCNEPGAAQKYAALCAPDGPEAGTSRGSVADGSTGIGSGGATSAGTKGRPTGTDRDYSGIGGDDAGGSGGGGGGGSPGGGLSGASVAGGAGAAGVPIAEDEEPEVGSQGFMNAGGGPQGSGGSSGLQPFQFSSELEDKKNKEGEIKTAGKDDKDKTGQAAGGNRKPASETSGPFADNFQVIKKGYKETTASLY